MTKICMVTCYKDPDYVRARVLRAALASDPDNMVIVVKNSHKNLLRYPEVLCKLALTRLAKRPDVYLLTFRGYELLPFVWLLTLGKRRVFDEFINFIEWVVFEHQKLKAESLPARLLWLGYRWLLQRYDRVLTDTQAHADYSAELMKLPHSLFIAIPVGTDETVFTPRLPSTKRPAFQVFYYGNMLPLHGLSYVLGAAVQLRDNPHINFLLIGGKDTVQQAVQAAQQQGAHIRYKRWVPFEELPKIIADSSLCLGGPFGGTLQAKMVVTGKTYQFLAMGAPTLVGKTKEETALRDGKNCLLVPQADAGALADKIRWAEAHQTKLETIGKAGRATFEDHYATPVIAGMLADVINSL